MFDGNVFKEKSFRNVREDGQTIGYELETNITYYRGIPLSMVNDIRVLVDGVEEPRENVRFTVDHIDWFTLDEMETVTFYKWEYNTAACVRVLRAGGLSKGEHEVTLNVIVRTAYIPIPLSGVKSRIVEVG